jgi:hypothetical protein
MRLQVVGNICLFGLCCNKANVSLELGVFDLERSASVPPFQPFSHPKPPFSALRIPFATHLLPRSFHSLEKMQQFYGMF